MPRGCILVVAILSASLGACGESASPPPPPTSITWARSMEAFASQYQLAMAEERMAMSAFGKPDFGPGHAGMTIPALQDAYRHLDKAAYMAGGGGSSPRDVGPSLLDLISDEQTTIQQMLGDYGKPIEWADYQHLQQDHQGLLAIGRELQQRGF